MSFGTVPASQYRVRSTDFHTVPFHCSSRMTARLFPPDVIVGRLYARPLAHWNGPDFAIVSFLRSDACAPVLICASVQAACAELAAGAVAGGGAATLRQFGLPVAAACANRPVVSTPTTPSTAMPAAVWNHRTAWIVFGPSLPSIAPALQPSALSWRCSDSMPAASLVLPAAGAALAGAAVTAVAPATMPIVTSAVITA